MMDAVERADALAAALAAAKTIDEVEAAWSHYYSLESLCEMTWSNDRRLMETLGRLKQQLGAYTSDVRKGFPSPYRAYAVTLGSLRSQVGPQWDKDGYPLKG